MFMDSASNGIKMRWARELLVERMRTKTKIELNQVVSNLLDWFTTVEQSRGFGGPVVHYWDDSLSYIGPGTDWRYEGLITGLLSLEKNTKNSHYLEYARSCGEYILKNQRDNGTFNDSAFEANPSMGFISIIHECAVDIALLRLGTRLEKMEKGKGQPFIDAARKNIDGVLIARFWNDEKKTFQQYEKGQCNNAPNLFVPNKIATACEALLLLTDATRDQKYAEYATHAGAMILSLQSNEKPTAGGIFQANDKEQIITYYTARCVSPLFLLYAHTKEKRFQHAAQKAARFIISQQLEDGSFAFGYHHGKKIRYPIFGAGTGDVLRALKKIGGFQANVKKGTTFLLSLQQPTGGFASFVGLDVNENSPFVASWKDHLSVAGWNDKALRFLAKKTKGKIPRANTSAAFIITCEDGTLTETRNEWNIHGKKTFHFGKNDTFAGGDLLGLKRLTYSLTRGSPTPLTKIGRFLGKIIGFR
ncbi:MAG: prenyltransferase/squalene oxidase repeat-containing protein [Candidatus Diapherotrites archaeon]